MQTRNSVWKWVAPVREVEGVQPLRELGADMRRQVFAVVFAATIPMGFLQATSVQTDYAVSFWLVCFVFYLLLLLML